MSQFKTAKPPAPPAPPPPHWLDTTPGRIAAWSTALVAAIGVVTTAVKAWQESRKEGPDHVVPPAPTPNPPPAPSTAQKPEGSAPPTRITDKSPGITPEDLSAAEVAMGAVGWIYVGAKLKGNWEINSEDDPTQPIVTIGVGERVQRAQTYDVKRPVNFRAQAPSQSAPGARPLMSAKTGFLRPGRKVSVDDIKEFKYSSSTGAQWTWVFAHVTLEN